MFRLEWPSQRCSWKGLTPRSAWWVFSWVANAWLRVRGLARRVMPPNRLFGCTGTVALGERSVRRLGGRRFWADYIAFD
jgi:hypothetical protein